MAKPKLFSVQVPWCISLSTPFLRSTITDIQPSVDFWATFLKASGDKIEKRVTVTFTGWSLVQVKPGEIEGRAIDESAYDWGAIRPNQSDTSAIQKWLDEFNANWLSTGICPDPGFYRVLNDNRFLDAQGGELGQTQFMLVGEDISVNILARDFGWTVNEGEQA